MRLPVADRQSTRSSAPTPTQVIGTMPACTMRAMAASSTNLFHVPKASSTAYVSCLLRRERDKREASFGINPRDGQLLSPRLLHRRYEVRVVPCVDLARPMHNRCLRKPICNVWHYRAVRSVGSTGREDRRQLVDLRDPYQRPDLVEEFWRALCLYTVRKSRLWSRKSTAALSEVRRSYDRFVLLLLDGLFSNDDQKEANTMPFKVLSESMS
jgi:hypothetical protein